MKDITLSNLLIIISSTYIFSYYLILKKRSILKLLIITLFAAFFVVVFNIFPITYPALVIFAIAGIIHFTLVLLNECCTLTSYELQKIKKLEEIKNKIVQLDNSSIHQDNIEISNNLKDCITLINTNMENLNNFQNELHKQIQNELPKKIQNEKQNELPKEIQNEKQNDSNQLLKVEWDEGKELKLNNISPFLRSSVVKKKQTMQQYF